MEGTDLNLRQSGQSLEATDLNLKPAGQIQKESGLNLKPTGQSIEEIDLNPKESGLGQVFFIFTQIYGLYLTSGTYFYELRADNFKETKKLILIK